MIQVKLFREWSPKWPEEHKLLIKEKLSEIEPAFGEKLKDEILNGFTNGNGVSPESSPTDPLAPQLIKIEPIVA